jgi:ferredoxin
VKLTADRDVCCGAGRCAETAPEVFDQRDADGTVQVLVENPAEAQLGLVREAIALCPTAAIQLLPD